MVKGIANTIVFIVVVVVVAASTWEIQSRFFPTVKEVVHTDSIYVDKPYEVVVRDTTVVPTTVIRYKTRVDTVERVTLARDTLIITTVNDNELLYNTNYLTQYPNAPKFLEMRVTPDFIEFTGLSTRGITESTRWNPHNLWRLTLSNDNWVAFSGESRYKRGYFQEIGVGYQYGLDPSAFVSYGVGYEFGRFSGKLVGFGSKKPYISVGAYYEF